MIRAGIMNVYAHWVVQGATVSSNISYDYLMNVPSWYYSGLASYFGEHWNSDIETHVKDGILTGSYQRLEELSPVDATYAGHSFWKYLVDVYGEEVIAKTLYYTRSSKTLENGMARATTTPFQALATQWYKYYMVMFHEAGQVRVWLKRPEWKSPRCILRKYAKTEDNPDLSFPLIAWHPSGDILGLTLESKGDCLFMHNDL